jgi:hypothetical protein
MLISKIEVTSRLLPNHSFSPAVSRVAVKSRILHNDVPVTDWSAAPSSVSPSPFPASIRFALLSLAIHCVAHTYYQTAFPTTYYVPKQPVEIVHDDSVYVADKLPAELHFTESETRLKVEQVHKSLPMLGTAYVKPWSRVRDAVDLFDEYQWDDAPPLLSQPHDAVNVKRVENFRTTTPSPVITLTAEQASPKSTAVNQYSPTCPDPEPTEEQIAKWRKKYTTIKDGHAVFKKPSVRDLRMRRFQSTSHLNYKFKRVGDGTSPWAFEDGLKCEDLEEEQIQRQDPDQERNRAVDITGNFQSAPKCTQVRSNKLDQLIDDYNKQVRSDLNRESTQLEVDWWEQRLAREFRLEFEKERNRADVRFEQWRREALKLKNNEDFKHWHEVLELSPPPSWGMTRSAYRPEPRGKFRVVKNTRKGFVQSTWFDYVFDGPEIKQQPIAKVANAVAMKKTARARKNFHVTLEIIFDPAKRQAKAREEGIKVKSMQKREQRANKEIIRAQRIDGLFDPRMLSPKDIYQILEHGGSYVVLPGRTSNTLELILVDTESDPERRGVLDGLNGYASDDVVLAQLEMRMKKDAVAEIDSKNFTQGRRNRDVKTANEQLSRRFAQAEVVHFGDPENFRQQIIARISLSEGEQDL